MMERESVTAVRDSICQHRSLIISGCDFLFNKKLGIKSIEHNNANMQSVFSHWLTEYEYMHSEVHNHCMQS
jgi:hypothetical protein